jgi:hypothetical protein
VNQFDLLAFVAEYKVDILTERRNTPFFQPGAQTTLKHQFFMGRHFYPVFTENKTA